MSASAPPIGQFVLKVASRCNLDCSYCYVYHKADTSWRSRPPLMSDDIFEITLRRVRTHCERSGQRDVRITFHGGEPCLIGPATLDRWCTRIREVLDDLVAVDLGIQTNGTLIDAAMSRVLKDHQVDVGISMDGPKAIHDRFRLDHRGHGSYDSVLRGLRALQAEGVSYGIMAVIPFGVDGVPIHRHFVSLGCSTITYILPNFSHDTIGAVHAQYGPTPSADFLIPVFDEWWFNGTMGVCVRDLWNLARIIMGGDSTIETFGNTPPSYAFVESDGEIEGLDNLYVCADGMTKIGLNVVSADFVDIIHTNSMHRVAVFEGMPLPQGCTTCAERDTCAGGYLPHRYSSAAGFNNPSVWCADFVKLFAHLRSRMGIDVHETRRRRDELARVAAEARA